MSVPDFIGGMALGVAITCGIAWWVTARDMRRWW